MAKEVELPTPEQAIALFRARKKRADIQRFKRKILAKLKGFHGLPFEVPTLEFTLEVVDAVIKELKRKNWKVERLSEFEGSNPRIRLEMQERKTRTKK